MSKRCLTCGMYSNENEKLRIRIAELIAAGDRAARCWSDAQSGYQSEELLKFRDILHPEDREEFGVQAFE